MQSMTGYAERSFSSPKLQVKVCLKSLNHRYLDWSYKGVPLGRLEDRLRTACQHKIRRGRVETSLELTTLDPARWELFINEPLLAKLLRALEKTSGRSGIEARFSVDNIFRIPNVVELRRRGFHRSEEDFLFLSFDRTLDDLVRARGREGRAIVRQIKIHVGLIDRRLKQVENRFRLQRRLYPEKLRQKLQESNNVGPMSKEKWSQEIALLAQRLDITEEIVRLKSHLAAVRDCLSPRKKEPQGRMLDFLSQEMFREANTINAKSQDLGITRECLAIKNELETIRQQVQNLE